jgi:hypothetical protein
MESTACVAQGRMKSSILSEKTCVASPAPAEIRERMSKRAPGGERRSHASRASITPNKEDTRWARPRPDSFEDNTGRARFLDLTSSQNASIG